VLNRQMALMVPFGFLAAALVGPRVTFRRVAFAAAPLVIAAAALVLFNRWMDSQGVTPSMYDDPTNQLVTVLTNPVALATNLVRHGTILLLYVGLFCLPMLLAQGRLRVAPPPLRLAAMAGASAFAIAALAMCLLKFGPMPVAGNILTRVGFYPGAIQPYRTPEFFSPALQAPLLGFWWLMTVAAVVGGVMAIMRLAAVATVTAGLEKRPIQDASRGVEAFLLAAVLAYCGPMVVAGFYDRYLLPLLLLVPLLGATLPSDPRPAWARGLAYGLVGLFGLLSIVWVHDEMSWNRARWEAIGRLQAAGVPAGQLDGGFEFNSPRCFDAQQRCEGGRDGWERILDPVYMVAFEPMPGYREVFSINYPTWAPPGQRKILALTRQDAPAPNKGRPARGL
jgi:hypothetical protein